MAKTKQPALTIEQSESLVQGEEHRLLVRLGKPPIEDGKRRKLIAKVARATSFQRALEIIKDEI